jgi:hypothetical protein
MKKDHKLDKESLETAWLLAPVMGIFTISCIAGVFAPLESDIDPPARILLGFSGVVCLLILVMFIYGLVRHYNPNLVQSIHRVIKSPGKYFLRLLEWCIAPAYSSSLIALDRDRLHEIDTLFHQLDMLQYQKGDTYKEEVKILRKLRNRIKRPYN